MLFVSMSVSVAAGLNDTGQTLCYDTSITQTPCSAAVGGDAGVNPRQDGRYGRDARAAAGSLTKLGAGAAGFDFTKVGNNGSTLAGSAELGTNATDWACTKDNVTGLTWEIKKNSGLRSKDHTYRWYSTDINNGGFEGSLGGDTCSGTLSAAPYNNQCNTQYYVAAVNAATLCGASDWRLPTRGELLSLVHAGSIANVAIDTQYFPNTSTTSPVWTASTVAADPSIAWVVAFGASGQAHLYGKAIAFSVMLVRVEP